MKLSMGFICAFVVVFTAVSAFAGFIDFEDGTDSVPIRSSIPGLEFTNTAGYDWIYGDWRTGEYNGPYPYGPDPLAEQYWSEGNFFAWLGTDQGAGVISFTQSYATYFQIGYSAYTGFYLEAYDVNGTLLDSKFGMGNLNTGRLDYLRVEAPGMAYVVCHDTGNFWLVDNLETDAIQQCTLDEHCDDGVYCNGAEVCLQYQCQDGEPVECADDGIFCNGTESCSEELQACVHSGDPCAPDECDELTDSCPTAEEEDEPDSGVEDDEEEDEELPEEEDEDLWPEGKVTGGCGC